MEDTNNGSQSLKILVVGATGGTGRATVELLAARGHRVTAFSRSAHKLDDLPGRIRRLSGDATRSDDVEEAVRGQDAVIVILGISENPLRVRTLGPSRTPVDVRSQGTRNVIAAMRKHGVARLAVQSSFGVGDTRQELRFLDRLFFKLILKPQIADTEVQEELVRDSGLDWVLVQPVHLTNHEFENEAFTSTAGAVRSFKVARKAVADFLAGPALGPTYQHQSVAISG